MNRMPRLLWAALGTLLIGLGAVPAARVPIVGDDFQAFFETYAIGDGDVLKVLAFGWHQGTAAGHFNPIGQALGALHHFTIYRVSAGLGVPPQLTDVAVGTALIWLTVLAAATVLVNGLRYAGLTPRLDLWRAFALLAGITAVTLQLHPWTNDPVTTYLPAGWGSAVIGFALLGLALHATLPGRRGWVDIALVGVVALVAVLYYEMLVGMVVGTAVVYAGTVVRGRRRGDRPQVVRALVLSGVGVVLPALVFVGGRLLAAPAESSNYSGTTISLGPDALHTWWVAMVGAVPTGGWPYLIRMSGGRIPFETKPVLFALALLAGVVVLVAAWRRVPVLAGGWSKAALVPVGAVVAAWAATTATHATSQKYIDEIKEPGQVYLYYAVGVICVALLIAALVVTVLPAAGSLVRSVALLLLGAFVAVQAPLNWQLSQISAEAYGINRNLSAAAADDGVPERIRCDTLLDWAERGWPEYYLDAVSEDVLEDFERAFGEPFCSDRTVLRKIAALPVG
jgi:hypothetical protein